MYYERALCEEELELLDDYLCRKYRLKRASGRQHCGSVRTAPGRRAGAGARR